MKRVLLTAVLLAGCVADRNGNPGHGCSSAADCDGGICYGGFCIASDAGRDAGPFDAGCTRCYTGPDGTMGMGVCRQGCQAVGADGSVVCEGQSTPSEETCNQLDDDCDGVIDDGFALDTEEACGGCTTACATGEDCCEPAGGGVFECANVLVSREHCGGCGTPCPGSEICCGTDGCTDTMTDNDHCGSCGNQCAPGRVCCSGSCMDPRTNNDHCGGCPGETCLGTAESVCCPDADTPLDIGCRPMADCATCPDCNDPGELCCAGVCLDTTEDDLNCGACGLACEPGERCCGSACVSVDAACGGCDPSDACDGDEQCCGDVCVDDLDADHCGGCGIECDPLTEACCADGCVDLRTNNANCGECEMSCGSEVCSNGNCCPAGTTWCGVGPGCQNTQSNNPSHCGACNTVCPVLTTCNRGLLGNQPWGCRAL